MNNRSAQRDVFFSLAIIIIFALLFSSCSYVRGIMYKPQLKKEVSYNKWDANGDNVISETEFYDGVYKTLDLNSDSYLDEEEWSKADYFFSTYPSDDYGEFNKWDSDNNNYLNEEVFIECFSSSKLYASWDVDKNDTLDNSEFFNGIFDTWDINNDATLSSYEAKNWQAAAL